LSKTDFSDLPRFVRYAQKMFQLNLLAGAFSNSRPQPKIPGRAVALSLLLGEVAQIRSQFQLQAETEVSQWQEWVGYQHRISDDTLNYVSERMEPGQLRRGATWINRKLKRGKAFAENKINGLLVVSLDANEQFCSDHRCCADCLTREITSKDAAGEPVQHTQYYHKQVYAQLSGPHLSVILDVEPMRQGEEECAAALRLLERLRENYGPRFFDVVVVDAWYTNGPFLKAVVEMDWPVISVLKQARYDIYGETLALTHRNNRARRAQSAALGPARDDLHRELHRAGASGAGAGKLEATRTHRWPMDAHRKRRELDLDRGRRSGCLCWRGDSGFGPPALEN
jgi:hypothetical protein